MSGMLMTQYLLIFSISVQLILIIAKYFPTIVNKQNFKDLCFYYLLTKVYNLITTITCLSYNIKKLCNENKHFIYNKVKLLLTTTL